MAQRHESGSEIVWESSAGPELTTGLRLGRIGAGTVAGLLLAVAYSLVAGTIDALLMRDVPLRIDWPGVWLDLVLGAVGGGVLGAVTAWPQTGWRGVLVGAASFVAWSFVQSALTIQAATLVFLPLFIPLMVMSMPLAAFLRWSAGRLHDLQAEHGPARWRGLILLALVILGFGGFAGSWSQMPAASREAVRRVNVLLQKTLAEPTGARLPLAFQSLPTLRGHAASPYQLEQQPSNSARNQTEVRVWFDDGYLMSCTVETEAGWMLCREGATGLFGDSLLDPSDQR